MNPYPKVCGYSWKYFQIPLTIVPCVKTVTGTSTLAPEPPSAPPRRLLRKSETDKNLASSPQTTHQVRARGRRQSEYARPTFTLTPQTSVTSTEPTFDRRRKPSAPTLNPYDTIGHQPPSYYDVPQRCDSCLVDCQCANGNCRHDCECTDGHCGSLAISGNMTRLSETKHQQLDFAKHPSLIYDHVGRATVTDELETIEKQRRFFLTELKKRGTVDLV